MELKLNKKGSHVGVILSFIIFISFMVFLFAVLEPSIKTGQDKKISLENLKTELNNYLSSDLMIMSLRIDERITFTRDCIRLDFAKMLFELENLSISNKSGEVFSYDISGNHLLINTADNYIFKIVDSELIEPNMTALNSCDNINADNYSISFSRTQKYIFENKILELINEHSADYENLKSQLKIPADENFGLSFSYSNGSVIKTDEKDALLSVYSKKIPIEYADKSGIINSGYILVKVW